MNTARFLVGDVFDRLATLEDGSVDLVVTSPPFLALRSYLPADHPDKDREIGSEATPAEFIDVMLRVTHALRRVLAPHGSICIELGDKMAESGGAGGDYNPGGLREGQPKYRRVPANTAHRLHPDGSIKTDGATRVAEPKNVPQLTPYAKGPGWPLAKSKALIPELYRIALAYGRNPLRHPLSARELLAWAEIIVEDYKQAGGQLDGFELLRMMRDYTSQYEQLELGPYKEYERWRVRNVVTWCRPNPPVGALGDKWRPATSDVVVACVSDKRYWDDLATRKPHTAPDRTQVVAGARVVSERFGEREVAGRVMEQNAAGAPLLDYWEIPPTGYSGAHYAVYPPALVEPCVKAMAPPKVCRTCGEPSRRITNDRSAFDVQPLLAAHIKDRREALGITSDEINGWFGFKEIAKNWERTDSHGAAIPSAEVWPTLKERLSLSDEFDAVVLGERRWTESLIEYDADGKRLERGERRTDYGRGGNPEEWGDSRVKASRHVPDKWSDCGHDNYRSGLVLDPFAGSGTTLQVATGHGHDAIGIDLDERNAVLACERVGDSLFHSFEVVS